MQILNGLNELEAKLKGAAKLLHMPKLESIASDSKDLATKFSVILTKPMLEQKQQASNVLKRMLDQIEQLSEYIVILKHMCEEPTSTLQETLTKSVKSVESLLLGYMTFKSDMSRKIKKLKSRMPAPTESSLLTEALILLNPLELLLQQIYSDVQLTERRVHIISILQPLDTPQPNPEGNRQQTDQAQQEQPTEPPCDIHSDMFK